eukprot:scpid80774/ scgid0099/ Phytanoyl-CoA dioxygenase, peroxisomal; Phytanic acid oxidase; Phytanoyl-CoA alpha-hydroxylase
MIRYKASTALVGRCSTFLARFPVDGQQHCGYNTVAGSIEYQARRASKRFVHSPQLHPQQRFPAAQWQQIRSNCTAENASATSASASPIALPDDLRQRYDEDGYVIIPDLLSKQQVTSLMDEMEAICRGLRGDIPGVQVTNDSMSRTEVLKKYLCIHFPHKISTVIRDLTRESNTVAVLQKLLGPNIKCMQTMMFMKASGKPGQACHQDEFYIPTRDRSLCASWIALDNVTIENGCVWVIPGSHRPGIIWPAKQHNDERFDFADASYGYPYSEADFIPVQLPPGSAVFFNGYLLHRSLPNKSHGFRRAFANHYMRAESFLPWTNDGRFDIKDDMRDFLLVSGIDPYADFKPMQSFTKPFLRGETAAAA